MEAAAVAGEIANRSRLIWRGDGTAFIKRTFTVKKGQPVKYIVDVKENGYGCMSTIMVQGLYNSPERLTAGQQIVTTFTPQTTGDYNISRAMGVPRGRISVID